MPRSADADLRRARWAVRSTFFLTGALFATWASRVPAIARDLGLGASELAIAFMGLNAGAIAGLQLRAMLVPLTGSRPALRIAPPAFAAAMVLVVLASDLASLTVALVFVAAVNSVVDVAMNAHGVAVERRSGRPLLSGMHAMHPLGGIAGAGAGACAARLAIGTAAHFAVVAALAGAAALWATRGLLSDAEDAGSGSARRGLAWFRGWSTRAATLGLLAFCVTLAEGSALDWAPSTSRMCSEREATRPPWAWLGFWPA